MSNIILSSLALDTLNIISKSFPLKVELGHCSCNVSTNDRPHQHFFIDSFFATSKAGTSTCGDEYVQLSITDKGFIYVVPMPRKKDVPNIIKAFAKEIGVPEAFICYATREQIPHEVRSFCNQMGTALCNLVENTPCSNRAERYIGIINEGTQKDMQGVRLSICSLGLLC